MAKNNYSLFLTIVFLLMISLQTVLSQKRSLVLPYKVYNIPVNEKATKEQIYQSMERNYIYTLLDVGNPTQKLPIFYNFNNSDIYINSAYFAQSNFNPSNSQSFKKLDAKISQEDFTFIVNNEEKVIKNLKFLYNNENKDSHNYYAYAGLQNFYLENHRNNISKTNFLHQLKTSGLIDYLSFSINQTSEDGGFINFNLEPNEFEPNLYSDDEKYKIITNVKGVDSDMINEEAGEYLWSLDIDLVYYKNREEKMITVNTDSYELNQDQYSVILNPAYGLIKGPFEFRNLMRKDFFGYYIKNKICSLTQTEKLHFFSCDANYKEELKEDFPSLVFYNDEQVFKFILDFDDLFVEKNGILFFLICYDTTIFRADKFAQIAEWILGKPFFKKYQFSFDVEKKDVNYYINKKGTPPTEKVKAKPKNEYLNKSIDFNKVNNKNLYVNKLIHWKNLSFIALSIFVVFVSFFCISYQIRANHKKIKDEKKKGKTDDNNDIELKETLNDGDN